MVRLDRLRLSNGKHIAFDMWLPLFYAQLLEGHDLTQTTICHILESEYDVPGPRGRFRIEAVNTAVDIAERLDVPQCRALLRIERVSFITGDRRVYFQRCHYRGDRVAYELELKRNTEQESTQSNGMPLQEFEPVFKRQARGKR